MTNLQEQENFEPTANPYNARKEWHVPDAPHQASADSLFLKKTILIWLPENFGPKNKKKKLQTHLIIKSDMMI